MTTTPTIQQIAVVGAGYMGGGIAVTFAAHGYQVLIADVDAATAERARDRLHAEAKQFEANDLVPLGFASAVAQNLSAAESMEAAVADADFIMEVVPEIESIKLDVLRRLSTANPTATIGTNTSAIPITSLAVGVENPDRFLGVHWMNPAPFIPCVEIIPHTGTREGLVDFASDMMRAVGKRPSTVSDSPGFVANRLQYALLKEASTMLSEGVATAKEIDAIVSNSFGFRLSLFGPFAIADMAGLDVYQGAFGVLERAYGERFSTPDVIEKSVAAGNFGIKTGKGLLDLDAESQDDLLAYRDRAYVELNRLRDRLGESPALR
ncbi:3-hydroxyacyl-CoA dehydrogenase [Rhodococcus sp. 06-462-5]|uniref:3-hydroxyacyl-CoA dehydrogenase family protein n=1 Tax=unclassified Rhodococcus (in: high G+C Gram-positive bacteria) TaxID=192944 RepID=UPI000B9A60E0|nr:MULTISPECIES: 3-hydroxyacyl-CoA dehydrogenase NAD-binding domain-containing protein [unclassified Rhodococcus (in: high G+C Gram-positive bacteria)]OZC73609.1 3-hydroxyacyl-CoA dehydrogenase [Rhodococcus sp. 06-462-5]OZE63418.1 3-hydroxyacyl-CoA dehydrogenase [Rhodococcus sp. 02-925g]